MHFHLATLHNSNKMVEHCCQLINLNLSETNSIFPSIWPVLAIDTSQKSAKNLQDTGLAFTSRLSLIK